MKENREPEFKRVKSYRLISVAALIVGEGAFAGVIAWNCIGPSDASVICGFIGLVLAIAAFVFFVKAWQTSCGKYQFISQEILLYNGFFDRYIKTDGKQIPLSKSGGIGRNKIYSCVSDGAHFETLIDATGKIMGLKRDGQSLPSMK